MSKIAFIYPGQGAQKTGMGKDFYENSPLARDIYDRASECLKLDMRALCFEENDLLDQTEYTQAAMVTTCLAMTAVLNEQGAEADVTAGLSLGEYCAIAEAGAMDLLDPPGPSTRTTDAAYSSDRRRRDGGSAWNGCRSD